MKKLKTRLYMKTNNKFKNIQKKENNFNHKSYSNLLEAEKIEKDLLFTIKV